MTRRFVIAGVAIEAIYLYAALGPLSLLAHGTDLVDLGKLTGVTVTAALAVTAGLLALFGLYAVALANNPVPGRDALAIAIGFTLLFSATLVFVYPATAIDVYNYSVEGHVAAFDQINPLVTAPSVATSDDFTLNAGMWAGSPSPYGPIWIQLSKVVAIAAGSNIVLAVILFKAIGALSVAGTTLLLAYALGEYRPEMRLAGAIIFGWNPLVQIDLVGNAHNDALVTILIVSGFILLTKRLAAAGAISIGAALLIKVLAIGVLPVYLFAVLIDSKVSLPDRIKQIALIVGALLALTVAAYAPFWVGPETIHRLLIADGDYLASLSSLVVFVFPSSRDWLQHPRVAIAAVVGLWQLWSMLTGRASLAAAAFEVLFATIILAAHFAGWYLPLLLAIGILSTNQAQLRRVAVFTLSATLTTPLWAYAYTLSFSWMTAESFHFIVVPLTFIPPLLLTFPPSQRFIRSLTLRGQERVRDLVPTG